MLLTAAEVMNVDDNTSVMASPLEATGCRQRAVGIGL